MVAACGRWQPAREYRVSGNRDVDAAYDAVRAVIEDRGYRVTSHQDKQHALTVRTKVDEDDEDRQSFIKIEVRPGGQVRLTPSGYLVKDDGTIHKKLADELSSLEIAIRGRLRRQRRSDADEPGASPEPGAPSEAGDLPHAFLERSQDPKTWGPGEFTCVPVELPKNAPGSLKLLLSTGEAADIVLSVAYDAALCTSEERCPLSGGCPALGLGDAEKVRALAGRLENKEIESSATLVLHDLPVAVIELSRHGSIVQALPK